MEMSKGHTVIIPKRHNEEVHILQQWGIEIETANISIYCSSQLPTGALLVPVTRRQTGQLKKQKRLLQRQACSSDRTGKEFLFPPPCRPVSRARSDDSELPEQTHGSYRKSQRRNAAEAYNHYVSQ